MAHEDKDPQLRITSELWCFLRAFSGDWIAIVSGAASVVLSILAAWSRTNLSSWTFWAAAGLAFVTASFRVWVKENRELTAFLQEKAARIEVHGIPTVGIYGEKHDRPYLILPDVTITNPARRTGVSIGVEMWMKMMGGVEGYCAAESSALKEWETNRGNYRNQHLSFPLNLEPQHTVNGYIACAVQRGIAYDRPVDPENGLRYFPCRIEFKDYLTEPVAVIHKQEIKFYV
ncbi:MAG: hypothetical protein HY236_01625 [Acidobacteria bacterium]|nr:hypothetical protein [Acidobacteriota bacterium]